MKFFILFLTLFTLFSFTPSPVLAVVHSRIYVYTRLNAQPKTEKPKPKWIKIIERILPFSMAVGFVFAESSLGNKGFGPTEIVRPTNLIIGAILLIISLIIALILFVHRMIKLIKNRKRA